MDDLNRINAALDKYPKEIYDATVKTENARLEFTLEDAKKDYLSAQAYLRAKAESSTDGVAKEKAREASYITVCKVLELESKFRRALAEQSRIENEFTSVRKQANLLEMTLQKS